MKKKEKRSLVRQCEKRSNDETRDKNVNDYNCCGCGCGEDVWCLARVNCTRGKGKMEGWSGDGLREYEGPPYGVADVILGAQDDFVGWFRGFQLLFESFRLPFGDGSRVSRLQRTALLLPPCRFDLPFFGISPRTRSARARTNRIKVRFKHFRPKVDSGTVILRCISKNREIIDPSSIPWKK